MAEGPGAAHKPETRSKESKGTAAGIIAAEAKATHSKTLRLKAQRLEKEAADRAAAALEPPAKKKKKKPAA